MPTIDEYERNLNQVLVDAANDPSLQRFFERGDIEIRLVDQGDGTQAQVKALSSGAVRHVIDRILEEARREGSEIQNWICSKEEEGGFDLCKKLNDSGLTAKLMRYLYKFLADKWSTGGQAVANGLIVVFGGGPQGAAALAIFTALLFVNRAIFHLCKCPPS
mgnify:CR=1 FL=1